MSSKSDELSQTISVRGTNTAKDEAYDYVVHDLETVPTESEFPKWKVDWHIMPWLCGIYLLQFLDKLLLNYAAAMGIKENLKGNEFANLSTMFYGAYIFGEPVTAFVMQRYPILKVLGGFIISWGIVVACHSACKTYAELMVVRTLLGLFELSLAVGLIMICGMWYLKPAQAARMGLWLSMAGGATIVGALLLFGFQHIHLTSFALWQILFLFMGVLTVLFGIAVAVWLPDNVVDAKFLSHDEKLAVLAAIKANQTGTKCRQVKTDQIKELVTDPLTWPYFFLTLVSQIVTGAIGTFSVTVTMLFGFTNYELALLQIPVGALIIIIIICLTQLVRRTGAITMVLISMIVPSVVGAIVLLCETTKYGHLFGLYLLYLGSSCITLIYVWISANTSGLTKKFGRLVMTMVAFLVACIIGPQLFRATSAPKYTEAKIVILVTQAASIPIALLIGWMCMRQNRRKQPVTGQYAFLDITDRENPEFKYSF